jgi:hypothetical protein
MTTVDEPAATADVEELEEKLATYDLANNSGQVAFHNEGGMHQHIHKHVKGLRDAHALGTDYVRRTLDSLVDRDYRSFGRDLRSVQVEQILRVHHYLVLVGRPGTGRRTAAIGILGRLGLPLQEIPTWDPGHPGQFAVSDLPAEPGMGYLFQFPNGETAAPDFRDQLNAYVGKLTELGSYLVVVVSSTQWHATGAVPSENVLSVEPPSPSAVLRSEVNARAESHDLQPLLDDPRIQALIAQAPPRDVIRLAELILAIADVPGAEPESEQCLTDIVGAFQEWAEVLSGWFQDHHSATERVFLLAAAILEDAPARLVLRYAEQLGESLDGTRSGRYDITSAGIRELAEEIGAEVVGPEGRLRFKRPAYSTAVLDFFLADRSDTFRTILRDWFAKAPGGRRSGEAVFLADLIATAVLGITIRERDTSFLLAVVNSWSTQPGLRPALIPLLTGAALSHQVGSRVRQRLNHWATNSSNSQIRQVVAEVCSGELADAYPQIALTRLNNLAIRASVQTAEAVSAAVLRLWERPRMRREVLTRVLVWISQRDSPAFGIAVDLLAALGTEAAIAAYEHRLATAPALRSLLHPPGPPDGLRDILFGWLDLAVDDTAFAEWLVATIAATVPGPAPALTITVIRTFTREWQGPDAMSPRAALREHLLERLTVLGWETATAREEAHDELPV